MADLLFIGMMFVFFALAVVLVRVCDRIIGVDEDVIVATGDRTRRDDNAEIAA